MGLLGLTSFRARVQAGHEARPCLLAPGPAEATGPGKSSHPFELRARAGGCARVTAGQRRPHLGLCPGPNVPLLGRQRSRHCILDSPGESGLVSRGSQGHRSPVKLRRVYLGISVSFAVSYTGLLLPLEFCLQGVGIGWDSQPPSVPQSPYL